MTRLFRLPVLIVLAFAVLVSPREVPGSDDAFVPFPLPWDDDSPGPANVSFVLDPPAGGTGFVVEREGHFFTGERRIRFWGVNVCFGGCFPTHAEAKAIAGRLAKFGVNCVRFHHMDSSPFPRGIFADRRLNELSPEALERLDFFVAELARRGVYTNLNLHVSRWFSQAQGWLEAEGLPKYDKMAGIFHPGLIEAQKAYARDLLTHRNPYTGKRYVEEPALAMVEITNEDSLFMWGTPRSIARMPERYLSVLRKRWNDWLARRYESDEQLRAAWNVGAEPLGENLLGDPEFRTLGAPRGEERWICERHRGAGAELTVERAPSRPAVARIEIRDPTGVGWHVQLKQPGLRVKKSHFYTVTFRARAHKTKSVGVSVSQDHEPWRNLGLSTSVDLGAEWKPFRVSFRAAADEENSRLSFALGEDATAVELAGVALCAGGREALLDEESLAKLTVRLFSETTVTDVRLEDRLRFLRDTERDYFSDMRRYLREELGLRSLVTGTIGYGSLGTQIQSQLDFVDQHAYWQHPRFPRRPWDSRDWLVPNTAMSAARDGGTLRRLAATRVAGKPYTVTEYNHPAPLDSQAETVPMIATFAAWQDWDGVFLFAYNHSGVYDRERITGFFDIDGNPAKMGFCGVGSLIFCGPRLQAAALRRVERLTEDDTIRAALRDPTHVEPYLEERAYSRQAFLESRWAIAFDGKQPASPTEGRGGDAFIRWELGEGRERYIVDAPQVKVACGRLREDLELRGISLEVEAPEAASFVIVSRDGRPLARSRSSLIVCCGRSENTGMEWNKDRTSVSDRWGESPVGIEVVHGRMRIEGEPVEKVFALDERGTRRGEVTLRSGPDASEFRLGEGVGTLWYEVVR